MLCAAIVVAAGRGSRAGEGLPKQYRAVDGEPVLRRTLRRLCAHPDIAEIQVVIHPDDATLYAQASAGLPRLRPAVPGGADRQASVLCGLEALAETPPDLVLIHDAARPFLSPALISRAIAAARDHGAAVPGLPVTDTIKIVDEHGHVISTPDRAALRAVQTPQAFRYDMLRAAHAAAGHRVMVFAGETENVKLTHPTDFAAGPARAPLTDVRTGTGFDVHAFGPGDHVMLGGIPVPFTQGLDGHSDADVGLHALTDAVLGALCDGDIGAHFPPSDPQWKGATSDRFLAFAAERVRARGGVIAHLDLTLICEAPKVGPHRDAMRARIAEIVGLAVDRVSVKATTTERLGFAGRREGIAAMASATIRLPDSED
ncbi:MAG: bifunctional 2-C-methyl-D-erythritol 4-phosphate cytidylyltransferase/2-C-methyl-D-erythritol 2,4-cyclodiphosphate synthase [Azorhizobium sp. 32-67-21]|nr:MAG: bifunctional 2-C-methyl-D-erythritol 4-phosphate cytidylyltransferase/2-C-methyl-D-erythritol 2,4-cyclodiphosphate synthase [Azorhizobium sp. 32-67-21]